MSLESQLWHCKASQAFQPGTREPAVAVMRTLMRAHSESVHAGRAICTKPCASGDLAELPASHLVRRFSTVNRHSPHDREHISQYPSFPHLLNMSSGTHWPELGAGQGALSQAHVGDNNRVEGAWRVLRCLVPVAFRMVLVFEVLGRILVIVVNLPRHRAVCNRHFCFRRGRGGFAAKVESSQTESA